MSLAYHPQSDEQTEVTNRMLWDMLRCLVVDNIKTRESIFCKVEFAHNHALNRSTHFSLFRVVCGLVPSGPIDLGLSSDATRDHGQAIDFATISNIYAQVHDNLHLSSAKYKVNVDRHRRSPIHGRGSCVGRPYTRAFLREITIS
ncbi:hypothetical protein N665_0040s0073 [Sinapis alba]|nr:hypothetical protein N665_0040s0073 [Sinapis alba]